MNIGNFQNAENGRITGDMVTLLTGRVRLTLVPQEKGADYTVLTESGCEVGGGWTKTAPKNGKTYISLRLDSPFLPKPVNVALFQAKDEGKHVLVWDRQKPKED
jgi:uncharacterized protein (DUF736 family)